jgi:hypothetical protein
MLKGHLVTCRDSLWPGHTAVQLAHRYRRCKIQLQNILPSSYVSQNGLCTITHKNFGMFSRIFSRKYYEKKYCTHFFGRKFVRCGRTQHFRKHLDILRERFPRELNWLKLGEILFFAEIEKYIFRFCPSREFSKKHVGYLRIILLDTVCP